MTNLYKAEVMSPIDSSGVSVWWSVGTPVTVDGTPMVRLPHGVIVQAVGWSATVNEAANKAADRIDELRAVLESQASGLRKQTEIKR